MKLINQILALAFLVLSASSTIAQEDDMNNRMLRGQIGSGPPFPGVILYEHFDYQGRFLAFVKPGKYDFHHFQRNNFNDIASSLQAFDGWAVKLCFHNFEHCTHEFLTGNIPRFGSFNDQVSSVIITGPSAPPSIGSGPPFPGVILYEHFDYQGRFLTFVNPGHYDFQHFQRNNFNDIASSLQAFNGWAVKLCFHNFQHCTHEFLTGNIPRFGSFNDQVSSVIIIRN